MLIRYPILSPVGPPETYDVRERWLFKLLASSRLLLESQSKLSDTATRAHADELMEFFITDSTRRVRISALKSLQVILAKDTLTDLLLVSDIRGRAVCLTGGSGLPQRSVLVSECAALSGHTIFRERIVLYFIRLVGACWSPELISGAAGSSHYDDFADYSEDEKSGQLALFLSFSPTIFSDKFPSTAPSTPPIFTPPVQSAGLSDKTAAREASVSEISYHVICLLRSLSNRSPWATAIASVIGKILSAAPSVVSTPELWTSLGGIETLGTVVFLGESSGGSYLGATAVSRYSVTPCRVLSIHKAMSIAIVLSWNNNQSKRQLSTVRLCDLTGYPLAYSFELTPTVLTGIIELLDTLKSFTAAAVSDLLCTHKSELSFLREHLLRSLRPIEVFAFHQLLRCLSRSQSSLNLHCHALRDHQALFKSILQTSARTVHLPVPSAKIPMNRVESENCIPQLWIHSASYVAGIPKKYVLQEFPGDDTDITFRENVKSAVGVVMERFEGPQEQLVRQGLLSELVISNSSVVPKQSEFCANLFLRDGESKIPISDWGAASPTGFGLSSTIAFLFGPAARTSTHLLASVGFKSTQEPDASGGALDLMVCLRESIIKCSRELLTHHSNLLDRETFASLSMPWKLLLWHSFASNSPPSSTCSSATTLKLDTGTMARIGSLDTETLTIGSDRDQGSTSSTKQLYFESRGHRAGHSATMDVMISDLTKTPVEVTVSLASNLHYCHTTLQTDGPPLGASDLFCRFLGSAEVWLREHEDTPEESEICYHFLKILLPSLVLGRSQEICLALMKVSTKKDRQKITSYFIPARLILNCLIPSIFLAGLRSCYLPPAVERVCG